MAQTRYRTTMVAAREGQLADTGVNDVIALINDYPRAAQVSTITVDTAVNSTDYTVTIDGVDVTITSDATATKEEIATALAAAINAEALLNGRMSASASSDVVTVTARIGGAGFTITEDDANLTVATTTANAEAAAVPFGTAILRVASDDELGRACESGAYSGDINDVIAGVAIFEYDHEMDSDGTAQYEGGQAMSVLRQGRVFVRVEDAVTPTSDVFVRVSGTGAPFASSAHSGAYVELDRRFRFHKGAAAGGLAVLQIG